MTSEKLVFRPVWWRYSLRYFSTLLALSLIMGGLVALFFQVPELAFLLGVPLLLYIGLTLYEAWYFLRHDRLVILPDGVFFHWRGRSGYAAWSAIWTIQKDDEGWFLQASKPVQLSQNRLLTLLNPDIAPHRIPLAPFLQKMRGNLATTKIGQAIQQYAPELWKDTEHATGRIKRKA